MQVSCEILAALASDGPERDWHHDFSTIFTQGVDNLCGDSTHIGKQNSGVDCQGLTATSRKGVNNNRKTQNHKEHHGSPPD
jgi:hypothetical protein